MIINKNDSPELLDFFLRFIMKGRNRHKFGETQKIFLLMIPQKEISKEYAEKIVDGLKSLDPELSERPIYSLCSERGKQFHRFSFISRKVWMMMKTFGFDWNGYSKELKFMNKMYNYDDAYLSQILANIISLRGITFQVKKDIAELVNNLVNHLHGKEYAPTITLKCIGDDIRKGDKYVVSFSVDNLMGIVETLVRVTDKHVTNTIQSIIKKHLQMKDDADIKTYLYNKENNSLSVEEKRKGIMLGKYIMNDLTLDFISSIHIPSVPVRVVPATPSHDSVEVDHPISLEADDLGGHEAGISGTDESESIFSSEFPETSVDRFLRDELDDEMVISDYIETMEERMKRAIVMPLEREIPIDMTQERNYRPNSTNKTYYSYDPTWSVHRFWMDEMHSVDGSFSDPRRIAMEDEALSRWGWDRNDYKFLYLMSEFPSTMSEGERKSAAEHVEILKREGKYHSKMLPYWKAKGMAIPAEESCVWEEPNEF